MRKKDELTNPKSCMTKAADDEMTFVLLGRDIAAPVAIRAWVDERIRTGKNQPHDPQIVEANQCAATMERERVTGVEPEAQVTVELMCVESVIENEIKRGLNQTQIAQTYALALRSSWPTDWKHVNTMIVERWSGGALERIKKMAWSGKCFQNTA